VTVEPEIDTALKRVRAFDKSQVIDVLKRPHPARVVREVCVGRGDVNECERQIRIREWRQERKEELADTKDRLIGNVSCR
jgi:hypothetical protein